MTRAAFGIAREFNAYYFGIGGFDRFVSRHNVRTRAGTRAQDANGAIALLKLHCFQQGTVYVCNHQTYGVANRGANKFR